jgi:hypothetical protein
MRDTEKLELIIFRYTNLVRGGTGRGCFVTNFGNAADMKLTVERLKDLYDRGLIELHKYYGTTKRAYASETDKYHVVGFFDTEFEIAITGKGRRHFEALEEKEKSEEQEAGERRTPRSTKKIVFISCGQYTEDERRLGKTIARIVSEFGFQPFFAEEVQDLNGLDANILRALHDCAAFITVLHARGGIETPDGKKITRASVWIEQEIAIAAYIKRVENRELPVIAFKHADVSLEGIRQLLQLNPINFKTENDVIAELPQRLSGLGNLSSGRELPRVYNFSGQLAPINVNGKSASIQGRIDLSGLLIIANPTQQPMNVGFNRLVIDGKVRTPQNRFFRPKGHLERYDAINIMGNAKEDYEVHFLFPEADYPKSSDGELWLSLDGEETFSVKVWFP